MPVNAANSGMNKCRQKGLINSLKTIETEESTILILTKTVTTRSYFGISLEALLGFQQFLGNILYHVGEVVLLQSFMYVC